MNSKKLVDIPELLSAYYTLAPRSDIASERVRFGTSGHRGTAFDRSFNQMHILAITQAICDYRKEQKICGVLFMGKDTHALSNPAQKTALQVLAANGVQTKIAENNGFTPTPLISFAILEHNKREKEKADGIVMTPSHNPPEYGGYKYNPPEGGPANAKITEWIEKRSNELIADNLRGVKNLSYEEAMQSGYISYVDFNTPYVQALPEIVDINAIQMAKFKIAADPLGGASIAVYQKINEIYELDLDIINPHIDPTFSFMPLDHDGKIRMDCSSPYAMANLIKLKDRYDLAFGNDTDSDRHGIVTHQEGLLPPNHYLSAVLWYLLTHRKQWREDFKIGKTVVTSSMLAKIAALYKKEIYEVPVGFKWFSKGLFEEWLAYVAEESAGASFLRMNGDVWTTDKDGIIMNLLAAEIMAVTGTDPAILYRSLEERFGKSWYKRLDFPATAEEKTVIKKLTSKDIVSNVFATEVIEAIETNAPGNSAPIGGIKIITKNGWVAMRPSGTEDIYKIYAESFLSLDHMQKLIEEAQKIVRRKLSSKRED